MPDHERDHPRAKSPSSGVRERSPATDLEFQRGTLSVARLFLGHHFGALSSRRRDGIQMENMLIVMIRLDPAMA
jgi:hypothetical protein